MNYGISLQSIIPLRKEPREQAEMVSQLLFGEVYAIVVEEDRWIKILTQFDHYTGWIDRKLYIEIKDSFYNGFCEKYPPVLDSMMMQIEFKGSPLLSILAGSTLPGYSKKKGQLEIEHRVFHILRTYGSKNMKELKTIQEIADMFLNAPYLWGGRTLFGCDCSGFTQSVYKIMGIALARDSSQQAFQGKAVKSLAESHRGDLAFFTNEEGHVYHVGLLLSPNQIVHSSGYVRKDKLDETGIYNSEIQQYTHRLYTIRRILSYL